MAKHRRVIEVAWEYEPEPGSEQRAQRAFEMLLKDIPIGPEVIEEIQAEED